MKAFHIFIVLAIASSSLSIFGFGGHKHKKHGSKDDIGTKHSSYKQSSKEEILDACLKSIPVVEKHLKDFIA